MLPPNYNMYNEKIFCYNETINISCSEYNMWWVQCQTIKESDWPVFQDLLFSVDFSPGFQSCFSGFQSCHEIILPFGFMCIGFTFFVFASLISGSWPSELIQFDCDYCNPCKHAIDIPQWEVLKHLFQMFQQLYSRLISGSNQ